jgi:hypothetical protein
MFEEKFIEFSPAAGSVDLSQACIAIDSSDKPGIQRAARDLAEDFARVTNKEPSPVVLVDGTGNALDIQAPTAIIVGSIESSAILRLLQEKGKLDVASISGKWESFITAVVDHPFPTCERALVIAGSDTRGAIFGIYTLSEQIGVSP